MINPAMRRRGRAHKFERVVTIAAPDDDNRVAFGQERRESVLLGAVSADVISLSDSIAAKRASGRDQDLVDAKQLERRPQER